jgi:hypothetical protein
MREEQANLVGELATVYPARHDDVGEQQIDLGRRLDDLKRGDGVPRFDDRVAEVLQNLHGERSQRRIVLHDEDALLAQGTRREPLPFGSDHWHLTEMAG